MQFLKTLFWVVVAVLVFYLGSRNWQVVPLKLWGDIQVDIKAPVLIALTFLIGWLPTWLIFRTKLWKARQRLDALERQQQATVRAEPAPDDHPGRMSPIFVAIDTPNLERAKQLAEQVRANAGGVKLGLEFFSANGPSGVAAIARAWAAGLPRPEASRHPEHGREGGRSACSAGARRPHGPRGRRPGDA